MDYKSKISFCGLPLIHITTGKEEAGIYKRGIAKGWIAIGDIALGILFSCGGIALGLIAIGGVSLGVLSIAGLAFGIFALGGLAVAIYAIGGAAIAIYSAVGGFAAAFKYAVGGVAIAEQANNNLAEITIKSSYFFKIGDLILRHSRWGLALILIPIIANLKKR